MTRTEAELINQYGSLSKAMSDGWSHMAGNVYTKKFYDEDGDDNPFTGAYGWL